MANGSPETKSSNSPTTPSEQSDWDTLSNASNEELAGKYGRHTKEYLNSEFRKKEREQEQRFDQALDALIENTRANETDAEKNMLKTRELRKELADKKRAIRHEYAEWLLNNEEQARNIGKKAMKGAYQPKHEAGSDGKTTYYQPKHEAGSDGKTTYYHGKHEAGSDGKAEKTISSEPTDDEQYPGQPITPEDIDLALKKAQTKATEEAEAKAIKKAQTKATEEAEAKATEETEVKAEEQKKFEEDVVERIKSIFGQKTKAKTTEEAEAKATGETQTERKLQFSDEQEVEQAIVNQRARIKAIEEEKKKIEMALSLTAINADFTHDKRELSRDYAEKELAADMTKSGLLKKIWKGALKRFYKRQYENDIFKGERKVTLNGESLELDEIMERRSHAAIERFILGAVDNPDTSRYIHRKIGKKGENGESLVLANEETTALIKNRIIEIIKASEHDLGKKEFIEKFREGIKQASAEARDKGESKDQIALFDNYAEVAFSAYQFAEQGQSIENVMEGFRLYNAEVRNNQRTETHRLLIDKLCDKLEDSKLSIVLRPDVATLALSTFSAISSSAAIAVGGLAGSFAMSFAKGRDRITKERTEALRKEAVSEVDLSGMSKKQREKYEARIGGRRYRIESATSLLDQLSTALENKDKDSDGLLRAIAEAKVRIDYSDSEQKDLIAYSSADAMGQERLDLDIAVIKAEKELSKEDLDKLELFENEVRDTIDKSVKESDTRFKKYRALRSMRNAAITVGVGAALAEGIAIVNPNKIGVLEKTGRINLIENKQGATETFLARFFKARGVNNGVIPNIPEGAEGAYQEAGGDVIKTTDGYIEALPGVQKQIGINDTAGIKPNFRWADNATSFADGNERALHIDQKTGTFFTTLSGDSSLPTGEKIDVIGGVLKGKARLVIKIEGKTFECLPTSVDQATGQAIFGENGSVLTSTGELIQLIGKNGERCFESAHLALEDSIGADATHYYTSIASVLGDKTVGDIYSYSRGIVEHAGTYVAGVK